ncbi:hypothetical protein T492DRAFT_862849, partial [Pavlovales sp. CCMP2436]
MPYALALLVALPLAAAKTLLVAVPLVTANLESRRDFFYHLEPNTPAVSWGAVCPYYPKASAKPLTYDLSLKDGYVPQANLGYDWGVSCDLRADKVGFLVRKNGTLTLEQQ